MLHELLLTLSGYPGDIFQPFPPEPAIATTFAITNFPILHPSEKESLDQLAQLGFYFKQFNTFISNCRSHSHTRQQSGIYIRALANALERKLQVYRNVIVQAEAAILSGEDNLGGVIPLTSISARFAPFQLVFPAIYNLITDIEIAALSQKPCKGGKLINLLQDRAASGVPILEEWMTELLQGCYAVMMKQIVSWIVYGQIQDSFGEFFIRKVQSADNNKQTAANHSLNKSTVNPDMSTILSTPNSTRWLTEYELDESMIPTIIPIPLANVILFIGKSVATAINAKPRPIPIPQSMSQRHLRMILPVVTATTASETRVESVSLNMLSMTLFTNVIHQIRSDIANHLWAVVQIGEKVIRALESFKRYFLLCDGEFCLGLIEALEEFKKNRLSRRGQFAITTSSHTSIRNHDLGGILTKAAQDTPAQDDPVLKNFELRLIQTNAAVEQNSNTVDTIQDDIGMFDDQLLGIPVRLWYTMMWPLDFFLTAEDLDHYGDIFAFLLTVRKGQVKLQQAWVDVKLMTQRLGSRRFRDLPKYRKGKGKDEDQERIEQEAEILKHVAAMRSDMTFVVDCLWAYLQMDVISPTYDTLLRNIAGHGSKQRNTPKTSNPNSSQANAQGFDSIHNSHAETLHEIRRACLLTSNSLLSIIKEILLGTETFCAIVKRRTAGQDGFQSGLGEQQDERMWEDWTRLSALHKDFRENVGKLYSDLSEISRSGSLGDTPELRRSVSGLGSSLLGDGENAFETIRQLDQLLLRLEYSKSLWFGESQEEPSE
ncbi:hypothetical protein BGZ76_011373 [Entomortierella beljakovae]|nr:hypothetical protein BGZ76_011373 [Entomortierella beljakovae]